MKTTKFSTIATAIALAALAACPPGAFAQSIGINFVSGGDHLNNAAADSMTVDELAGAPGFAQTNWNNLGRYGNGDPAVTLYDGNAVATAVAVSWDAATAASCGSFGTLGTSDGKLMDGLLSTDWAGGPAEPLTAVSVYNATFKQKPLVFIGGLQAWLAAQGATSYKVVLYVAGWPGFFGTSEHWIQATTGNSAFYNMVPGADLTPHLFNTDTGPFNGTYTQVNPTNTAAATRSVGGNYIVFAGLTNSEILIRTSEPTGDYQASSIQGFQIVPVFPNSPPFISIPGISPSATVYAGSPVTLTELASGTAPLVYQWRTDGGGGGSLTNIPGATSTNLAVVPPNTGSTYTINYDVIVTNNFGAATSSVVTLSVNAESAPIITQDTLPGTSVFAYVGGTVNFRAAFDGTQPITYNWQSNLVNIANATNTTLTLANVQPGTGGSYQLNATNSVGGNNSTPATLTVLAAPSAPTAGEPYAYAVFTNAPLAYWRLSETADNIANSIQAYDYSGHGYHATYGNAATDNTAGPQSPAFPGLEATNTGVTLTHNVNNSFLTAPALNLNANTVTITAWINPATGQTANNGLFMWANGTDKAGFGFGGNSSNTMAELGYVWNTNSPTTFNFHSGLYAPVGQWSFVALTITPTNSTIYLYYIDGVNSVTNVLKAVQTINNSPAAFSGGTTWIGNDSTAGRIFDGTIDEVAVFGTSLSETQIQGLFLKAIGASGVKPTITADPVPTTLTTYVGQAFRFTASGGGAPPPAYQWQYRPGGPGVGAFVDLVNGGRISGANSGTLTVTNSIAADATDYRLVVTNIAGSATSGVATATLTPIPNNGIWTVNFAIIANNNGAPNTVYNGRGVLGTGNYWNAMPAGANFASSTSFRDDGSPGVGISLAAASGYGNWFSGFPMNNALLDPFCNNNGGDMAFVFTNVPNGTFNLAVYGINGAFAGPFDIDGVSFTVNGATQTLIGHQDTYFVGGDNAAIFSNVAVTNGSLLLSLTGFGGTETDFNGAQLQAVSIDPVTLTTLLSGSSLTLGWANYGTLLGATNVAGPWVPVAGATSPYTVTTTNATQFYRVKLQ